MAARRGIFGPVLILVLCGPICPAVEFEPWLPAPASVPETVVPPPPSGPRRLPATDTLENRPETLQEAWTISLAVDRSLGAKRFGAAAAQESLLAARAERWPSVALEGSYSVRDNEQAFRSYPQSLPLPVELRLPFLQRDGFAFRTRVDVPLYTSGTVRHGIGAAEAELRTADLDIADVRRNLMLQVAGEYVAVLRAQRDVEVADRTVTSLQTHLHDVRTRLACQQATHSDLLGAQVAVSNAQQAAVRARNLLDISRAAYNRRLGRPLTWPVWLAEVPLAMPREDVDTLTGRALSTHPALARLQSQIESLEHEAASQLAKNAPQVNAWGDYSFEENRYTVPEGIAEVGVGVSYNLWDAGRDRHRAAALRQQAEGLRSARADLESTIALEVRRAWLDVQQTRRQVDVTLEAIRRANENLRVTRKRHASAFGTVTEVLDAELLEAQVQRDHAHATYDAVLAVLRLEQVTGEFDPGAMDAGRLNPASP